MKLQVLIVLVLVCEIHCQTPIPHRPPGFVYKPHDDPKVIIEAVYDHLCIDSKASWPTLQGLKDSYMNKQVKIIIDIFPLPYHHNAYFMQELGEIVRNSSETNFADFIDIVFKNQDDFLTKAVDLTEPQVKQKMADLAEKYFNIKSDISLKGFDDPDIVRRSRYAWKYAASRGISGTPQYIVNGVHYPDGQAYDLNDWKDMIDSLFAQK